MKTAKMLCLLLLLGFHLALPGRAEANQYTIRVDGQSHKKFGLYYPATYKFRVPPGQAGLTVQYRYDTSAAWSALPEKGKGELFNGIDAARFDYPAEYAYVSVRFSRASDSIFLRAVDGSGQEVPIRFDSIPRYYDDRQGVVTVSLDDWSAWDDSYFVTASRYLGDKGLYFSVGVVTQDVPWDSLQQIIDRYGDQIEIASHSTYHSTSAPEYLAKGYEAEIIGSRDAIRNNLTFGAHPYVPLYIEPGGYSDQTLQWWLTNGDYLLSRDTSDWFPFGSNFAAWDPVLGRYGRASLVFETYGLEDDDTITRRGNALFDQAMAAGGIYQLMDHPWLGFWHDNSYLLQHVDYIRGRAGVWYVPLGQLYEYHYLQEMRGGLSVEETLPPVASFSATPVSGAAPLSVTFTDTSSGGATAWLWEFGDGSTASVRNPVHSYAAAGSYNVTLTVTGAQGSSTKTQPAFIAVAPPPLGANFSATPSSGYAPLSVTFTDTSSGKATGWLWAFGDGTSSTEKNPVHVYTAPGAYTVSLTVTGSEGSSTKTQSGCIQVRSDKPVAEFSAMPLSGSAPLSVTFTDSSSGNISGWLWDFGDGTTSTDKSPLHVYQGAGTYTATLTVTGPSGSGTATGSIAVQPPPPVAAFSATPLSGTAPLSVTFTDTSSGIISGWLWDFGDGTTSTLQNPLHSYSAAGPYTVKLSVSGSAGSGATTRNGYISVQPPPPPVADFFATPLMGSAPLAVTFTDTSGGTASAWQWDFGDGTTSALRNPVHSYAAPGTYSVTLTASSYAGSSTKTQSDYVTAWPPSNTSFLVRADSELHTRFGLYYPVTYKFRIPTGQGPFSAQYRYGGSASWNTLPEKGATELFNGIDAARFDYANGVAFLSVRYSRSSDDLYLRIVDASGAPVSMTFDSVPRYYDDRQAAVTVTVDDWSGWDNYDAMGAAGYLGDRGLYYSVGLVTHDVLWPYVQQIINRYPEQVEIASHGHTHASSAPEYTDKTYEAEVVGSRDAIRNNLSFNAHPYVPLYIEPGGYTDATLEGWLSTAGYLVSRQTSDWFPFGSTFTPWIPALGRYGRSAVVFNDYGIGDTPASLVWANSLFDQALQARGVYHLMDQPWQGFWHDGSYLVQHLDYIKGRSDIWYAALGQLYQYHLLQEIPGAFSVTPAQAP